jgi:hypothetical protein
MGAYAQILAHVKWYPVSWVRGLASRRRDRRTALLLVDAHSFQQVFG